VFHSEVLYTAGQRNAAVLALSHALSGSSPYHLAVANRTALSQAGRLLELVAPRLNMPRLHEFSALVALASGDRERAVQHWAVVEGYTQLLSRGDMALRAGASEDARGWYSIAIQLRPDASPAWCALGRVPTSPEAAVTLIRQATALDAAWRSDGERIGCWLEFGIRLYNSPLYKWDEAFQVFGAVIRIGTPSRWREVSEAYRHQGMILEVTGGSEVAKPYFARALEADPANPWAIVSSAQNAYRLNRDLSAALGEFRRAMALAPGDKWLPIDIVGFLARQNLSDSDAVREFCSAAPLSSFEEEDFTSACSSVDAN